MPQNVIRDDWNFHGAQAASAIAQLMPGVIGTYSTKVRQRLTGTVSSGYGTKGILNKSDAGLYMVESVSWYNVNSYTSDPDAYQGVHVDIYTSAAPSTPITIRAARWNASLTDFESEEYEEYLYFPIFSDGSLKIEIRPVFIGGGALIYWSRLAP